MTGLIKIHAFNTQKDIEDIKKVKDIIGCLKSLFFQFFRHPLKDIKKSIQMESIQIETDRFKAFYLRSTANVVVEYKSEESLGELGIDRYLATSFVDHPQPSEQINKIVENLIEQTNGDFRKVNMVLQIHGYNTSEKSFCESCLITAKKAKEIHTGSDEILLFLGYRWPSDKISANGLLATLSRSVLPLWLQIWGSLGVARLALDFWNYISNNKFRYLDLSYYLQHPWQNNFFDWDILGFLPIPILFIFRCTAIFVPIITVLMLMRASGYFQDSYRAIHYGVPDLVQFFRVFDYLAKKSLESKGINNIENNRIRLSFVAHSMGAFVTTNLIRILSDVFDNKNNGNTLSVIDEEEQCYAPSSPDIGSFFTLNRMILVSPDIPINTILLERSNFLGSSLVRFKESYLFSNRADMILLLFSTVANYLSFPSRSPQMGYRLGNLGIDHYSKTQKWWRPITSRLKWLINLLSFKSNMSINHGKYKMQEFSLVTGKQDYSQSILRYLIIGMQDKNLLDKDSKDIEEQPFLAQKFTYFDCTDYLRRKILDIKGGFEIVDFLDYTLLSFHAGFTHSGYFDSKKCPETHEAIYTIACQGYDKFAKTDNGKAMLAGKHEIKVLRPDHDKS